MTTATLTPPTAIKEGTFAIGGRALADAAAIVGKAAGKANSLTSVIQLSFKDQRVTISATDFDVAVSVKLPVKGKRAAIVGVQASDFVKVVKALAAEDTVEIVTGQEYLTVQAGDTVYHLPPVFDIPKDQTVVEPVSPQPLDVAAFARVVRIAGSAVSTDQARPILTGLYFHDVDGVATVAATDSYRLAVATGGPAGLTGLLPATAAKLAVDVFDIDEEVTFDQLPHNTLQLASGSKRMTMRLLVGEFPNYQNLMRPASKDLYSVTVARSQMIDALAKVSIVANKGAKPVKFTVTGSNMNLSVRVEGDFATDDIELTAGHTDVPDIALNPSYLAQLLKAVGASDNVQLGYVDAFKPVNLTDGGEDTSWSMLLMPVRVP